ncbi:MAG: iron-containing alcohol dehydrogenase [Nitrososphaerota archaeon]|jgi:glycerol dehydrogenase-like iron-containing ADH family enzyme|nr:iron-containing alcohol dehydrogenase [Nitrososphaerota archaeon]
MPTKFTWGKIDGLGSSLGRYAVFTQDVPWSLVKDRIGGEPVSVNTAGSLEIDDMDAVIKKTPKVEAVVGIGGGVSIDSAKWFAWKRKCSAIFVPTILSVNAYATPAAAVRKKGIVNYLGDVIPDRIVIDYQAIQSAPKRLNTSGTGDVYSCKTALSDWELSHKETGEVWHAKAAAGSRRILKTLITKSSDIKAVNEEGIKTLVKLHLETNKVQLMAGSPRPEEGSEHVYFYSLEELTGRHFLHGEVVGTGIYVIRSFQAGDEEETAKDMEGFGLLYKPKDYGVTRDEFVKTLLHMKKYASYKAYKAKLPYTILDKTKITEADAAALWNKLA